MLILVVVLTAVFTFAFWAAGLLEQETEHNDRMPGPVARKLGEMVEAAFRVDGVIVEDPKVTDPVSSIVETLSAASSVRVPEVSVLVVTSSTVNAMALPGGIIVVYTGLIDQIESTEQFAAILAHEMGHIAGNDPKY